MKRIKRHKIKAEPECSSREHEEHDLAYYIHDRVELMHQVFSILKYKDLKAMAPECVRNLPIGDLQELCTEELLGISSKRLLATLDGAEPPSDTESSSSASPDRMETISLDSISSDEEILSQSSKKKKHKHRRNSKYKSKRREKDEAEETMEVSKASRAGLTVLELLELQARARAIRAQLQNEQAKKQVSVSAVVDSDTDEVEIKEEQPDVVEISSGDEKPDITTLQLAAQKSPKHKEPDVPKEPEKISGSKELPKMKEPAKEPVNEPDKERKKKETQEKTVTKRVSDLIITVPQAKTTRKIKLNRNKGTTVTVTLPNDSNATRTVTVEPTDRTIEETVPKEDKKKRKKKKKVEKEGSDHDEITIQLSDSEKMDLLEDLNGKNYDRLSSSYSDSSVDSDGEKPAVENDLNQDLKTIEADKDNNKSEPELIDSNKNNEIDDSSKIDKEATERVEKELGPAGVKIDEDQSVEEKSTSNEFKPLESGTVETLENSDLQENNEKIAEENVVVTQENSQSANTVETSINESLQDVDGDVNLESLKVNDIVAEENAVDPTINTDFTSLETQMCNDNTEKQSKEIEDVPEKSEDKITNQVEEPNKVQESEEGELTDRESSEVEAVDIEPEVVCISDDEKQKTIKKKKKKDKKAKKEKKSKKSKQDFRERGDQNFYQDAELCKLEDDTDKPVDNEIENAIDVTDDDDVYEILELSDDSSCYEVEGTVLSKEPTAEEIEALSARIDEINRDDAAPEDNEQTNGEESEQETYKSWKERYLDSSKVKRVLTTANILNAIRKKNKQLKKKIEEAKKQEKEAEAEEKVLEEGSIEHYQTLPSSKHVDEEKPVAEEATGEGKTDEDSRREMKKDAKQLLKMYKKLLNSRKSKRREKKKKRKLKKQNGGGNETETPV